MVSHNFAKHSRSTAAPRKAGPSDRQGVWPRIRRLLRRTLSARADGRATVGFILLGGAHHILHLVPVAAALSHRPGLRPVVYVRTAPEAEECHRVLGALGAPDVRVLRLWAPSRKSLALICNSLRLSRLACLVVAERTSTLIRSLPLPMPAMVHIPHGAGDRAKGFEARIARFDHVIVAGPKDRRRMIEAGVATPDTCSVSGYIKTAAIRRIAPNPPRLFRNDRPVVLYNPHFDPALSSWRGFGRQVLRAFAEQDRFNLVFAPHVRLFQNAGADLRDEIAAFARPDRILVDPGSPRSNDMTYTRVADIYLGDVSSQVYEFLVRPGPCVFLASTSADWRDNPDFAHWRYGEVCHDPAAVMAAVARAASIHDRFRPTQIAGVAEALGADSLDPLEIAADRIAEIAAAARL